MDEHIELKDAQFEDMREIATINAIAWRKAYVGQVPQAYLDHIDVSVKQKRWEDGFEKDRSENRRTLMATRPGKPIGYVSFGPASHTDFIGYAEIYAVYLLPEMWGRGVGRVLFNAAVDALLKDGFKQLYILALDTNDKALTSYKKWGGVVKEGWRLPDVIGGMPVTELAITFDLATPAFRPASSPASLRP